MQLAPPLNSYPSNLEADNARSYGVGYGSGNEPFLEGRVARVLGTQTKQGFSPESAAGRLLDEATGAVDDSRKSAMLDLQKPEYAPLREKLGTTFMRAALVANRNPIAAVGFDPRRTVMDTVINNPNIGGLYDPEKDSIYANLAGVTPSSVLHESIHRGLQKLRERYPDEVKQIWKEGNLPKEEYVVRYLMKTTAGDAELGAGKLSDEQRQTGVEYFENFLGARDRVKALARLQALAQQDRANTRTFGAH